MDKYVELLETWSGELEDLCYELYHMLMKENVEERVQWFKFICEKSNEIDSDENTKAQGGQNADLYTSDVASTEADTTAVS